MLVLLWYIAIVCTLSFFTLVAMTILLVKMVEDVQQDKAIERESGLMDVTSTRSYEDEMLADIPENYGEPQHADRV